jgi:hypothetical protein
MQTNSELGSKELCKMRTASLLGPIQHLLVHISERIQSHDEQIHARMFLHFLYGITARTKDKPCSERGRGGG